VKLNWKLLRAAVTGVVLAAAVGCGGINGSHTITPASFFLPGLGAVTTPSTNAPTFAAVQ
jgi:hypothetical protein